MMKKLAILALALTLAAATACGDGEATGANAPGGSTAATGDTTTVEFFNQKSEIVDWMDEIIAAFEAENPGIQVTQTQVPNANQVLNTRIASGDLPDVIGCYPGTADFPSMVEAGVFADITDTGLLDNIDPAKLEGLDIDGRHYAVPLTHNAWGIFYNKTKFDEYGLEVPATWDEFVKLCADIGAVGEVPLCPSLKDAWTVTHIAQSVFMSFADYDEVLALVTDPGISFTDTPLWDTFIDRFDFIIDNSLPNSPTQGYPEAAADFAYGNALMCPMGIWVVPMYEQAGMADEMGIFVFPNDTGNGVVPIGVDLAVGVSAKMEHPEAAIAFAKHLASPAAAQYLADREGSPSTVIGVEIDNPQIQGVTDLIGVPGRTTGWLHFLWNPSHGGEWDAEMQAYTVHRDPDLLARNLDKAFEKE